METVFVAEDSFIGAGEGEGREVRLLLKVRNGESECGKLVPGSGATPILTND